MSAATTITLPFPLSVNNLFAGKSRRYPTRKYVAWRRSADLHVMASRAKRIKGPVVVSMTLHPADNRRRDADNCWKAVLDCLVRMQIIDADDNRVVRKHEATWGEKRKPAAAVVTITPVD